MIRTLLFSGAFFINSGLIAQITQTVKGRILDSETHFPLIGARVEILTKDTERPYLTTSNAAGEFTLNAVPVGKHELKVSYLGYEPSLITVFVISGRETVVTIYLQERAMQTNEIVVDGRALDQTINEMATISAKQFSIEETERYAGSRADPARMASNFAGVQGADDSRNDIIIRGNSPLGLLWRVEGVDIPNPNHFAVAGSTGGPVTILNNKFLDNSDLFMSAFPAQYGNSLSGVFDLNLRRGNADRHEFTGQFGFLGTEVLVEGPISTNSRSSYLFMGRYSTLSMFQALGIQIGTSAVPQYGDIAYKFNFPLKKGGQLSFWGLGGASAIQIKISEQTEPTEELYGEGDRDQFFSTRMFAGGLTYKKPLNERTFVHATLGGSYEGQRSKHDITWRTLDSTYVNNTLVTRIRLDSLYNLMQYNFGITRTSAHVSINHKINRRGLIKFGLNAEMQFYNMQDSVLSDIRVRDVYRKRWDYQGHGALIQPFFQYKYRITDGMNLTAGIHAQYFSLSNSVSWAEPRVGWDWNIDEKNKVKFGAGLHSQTQPIYTYMYDRKGNGELENMDMDFSRSIHVAAGYQRSFKNKTRIMSEVYFQHLYNIPVDPSDSMGFFSLVNMGSGFQRFFPNELVNAGLGRNYGVELTVEKFFSNQFFYLITASIFDSKYTGYDGKWRNTDYNANFATNFLAGYELKFKDRNTLSLGIKVTFAGGRRHGLVNIPASRKEQELIFLDSMYNEFQFRNYFRFDLRVVYRINQNKMTHELGLDLINILNTKNLLSFAYAPNLANPNADPIAVRLQLGFLPIFYYRIDFRLDKRKPIKGSELKDTRN
jgi:hypothetical protein